MNRATHVFVRDVDGNNLGTLDEARSGWFATCLACSWRTEPNLLTAGTHADELLTHLAEDH